MAKFMHMCVGVGMFASGGHGQVMEPAVTNKDLETLKALSSALDAETHASNASAHGQGRGLQVTRKYKRKHFKKIICPFLSTLVREGDLDVQDLYSRTLLEEKTVEAGLDPMIAKAHVDANFANIQLVKDGEKMMDIFDMEGNPNEHLFSTGIHDCATEYTDCKHDGVKICESKTVHKAPRCVPGSRSENTPNAEKFDKFWGDVAGTAEFMDLDQLGGVAADEGTYVSTASSGAVVPHPRVGTVDVNPIGGGTIGGSHQLLLMVFGQHGRIDREALRKVSIERRYPSGYKFGHELWATRPRGFNSFPLQWGSNSFGVLPDGNSWKEYLGGSFVKYWKGLESGVVKVDQCKAVCQQTNGCVGIKHKAFKTKPGDEWHLFGQCYLLSGVCYTEPHDKKSWDFHVIDGGHSGPSSCF